MPDLTRFPFDTWRRLVTQRLWAGQADLMTYGDPQGHAGLRAEIARHAGVSRGVRATAEQVVVTAGAQQTTDLVARVLLRPGDLAAVEDREYSPPRPSHQYPLGLSMSLDRRLELLDRAERNDAVLVEDDYDTEFRYTGRPLEPLHSLDSRGRVGYVGSFSKVLSPARHVRRMRKIYRERHELLSRLLVRDFAGVLTPLPSTGGLHLSAVSAFDTGSWVRRARRDGVRLYSLGDFGAGERRHGLVFGYGAVAAERIEPGLARPRSLAEGGTA